MIVWASSSPGPLVTAGMVGCRRGCLDGRRPRRLPVTGSHRLVGMISEADLARHLPDQQVAEFVESICAAS